MNSNSIGSFLAALRKANGLTQKQLADKLNVSDKAVSRWERDECAPDLSLIPVLAELYGVTSDEILRGRRADPNSQPTPQAEEKSKKRLQSLLTKIKTKYQIQCLISCLIASVGLIVAMVLNFAFQRSHAGFLIGCIFFLAAVVCQTIFHIQCKTALQCDDFDDTLMSESSRDMLILSQRSFSVIAILFTSSIPFLLPSDPYWGLSFRTWFDAALQFDIIVVLLCVLVCRILNVRAGIAKPINWKSLKNTLRIRTIAVLLIVLMVTTLLQGLFGWWLDEHLASLGDSVKFETLESFKAYMELPMSDSGELLTYYKTVHDDSGREIEIYHDAQNAEYWYYMEQIQESVYNEDGESILSYKRYNENIGYITYSSTSDQLPIYVQTTAQRHAANAMFEQIMLCWIPVYILEVLILFLRYRKKKKQIG